MEKLDICQKHEIFKQEINLFIPTVSSVSALTPIFRRVSPLHDLVRQSDADGGDAHDERERRCEES